MPLDVLCKEIAQSNSMTEADARTLVAILGMPPSGEYLIDGLRRTIEVLNLAEASFDACFSVTTTRIDRADQLRRQINVMLEYLEALPLPADDPKKLRMARDSEDARHPLRGYCLSRMHFWCLLFYELNPAWDDGATGPAYQQIAAEVAVHILAANSQVKPDSYFSFCREHWKTGEWPASSPLKLVQESSGDTLASRVANAAVAVRQLAHPELGLADAEHDGDFDPADVPTDEPESDGGSTEGDSAIDESPDEDYKQVRLAISPASSPDDFGALVVAAESSGIWSQMAARRVAQLSRLLEAVRPFHHRANSRAAKIRAGSRNAPRGTARRALRDGYVRLPGSDYVEQPSGDAGGGSVMGRLPPGSDDPNDPRYDDRWMPTDDRIEGELLESILAESEGRSKTKRPATAGSQAHQARWAAEQARRYRLLLPFRIDSLHAVDGAALLRAITEGQIPGAFFDANPSESENDLRERLSEALGPWLCSLALGRAYKYAFEVRIVLDQAEAEILEKTICFCRSEACWSIPFEPPAWRDLEITAIERPVNKRLVLPDLVGFSNFLRSNPSALDGSQLAAKKLTQKRRKLIADWIEAVTPGCAVSIAGVERSLFERLVIATSGDIGLASLITGRKHAHSGSVAHYAHYTADEVQTAYANAFEPLGVNPSSVELLPGSADKGYGAKRVPTRTAVSTLLQGLRNCDSDDLYAKHNQYTLYTYSSMHLGIALRSIVDPRFKSVSELLGALVSWTDKARTDYHRRVSILCDAIVSHLRHYAEYLNLARATDFLPRRPNKLANAALLYFIDGNFEPLRPIHFERATAAYYPLEPYSLRRFMRTELAAHPSVEGCDLDAFFGHWFDRASPHDPFSCYALQRMRVLASGPVPDVLASVGFQPMTFQW
nr:hypothetical protein [Oceanococcus sp. HetDA_MAG_MS8]